MLPGKAFNSIFLCGLEACLVLSGCGGGVHAARGLKPLEVLRFSGKHTNGTLAIATLDGGNAVVSSGSDGTTRIWDANTGREARRFTGSAFRFRSVAFAPDGLHVLTSTDHAPVRYWTLDGKETHEFPGGPGFAVTAALSDDGLLAAAAGGGSSIHIWETGSGKVIRELPVQSQVVRVGFEGALHDVISIEANGRFCRWPERDRSAASCFSVGTDPVSRAAFSADGRVALIGTQFGGLELWSVTDQALLWKFRDVGDDVVSVALSGDGKLALLGCADKTVRLWNMITRKQVSEARGSGSYITCVAFSPDAAAAVFGSDDGEVALWRLR